MNKKLNLLIGTISLVLITLIGVPTFAHGEEEPITSNDPVKTTQTTEQSTTPKTSEQNSTDLKARLDQRKEIFKTRLTTTQKIRIQSRCKNSQGLLSSLEGRIKGVETSREKVYSNAVGHLTDLSTKLQEKGLDTSALDAHIETLKGKIELFNTDLKNYKQAVIDLAAMDCATEPDGFKASLDEARSLRQKLYDTGKDIKAFIKDTIKPALGELRSQIKTQTESNDKSETSTSGGDE